jgi:hypothetical protein
LGHVSLLSGCRAPARAIAESLDQSMELGSQPAARAANRLRAIFFWAPAAC